MPDPIKVAAVIPAYNFGPVICQVVSELFPEVERVYLVDDGSDKTNKTFYYKCLDSGKVELITLPRNLGKGYALFRGIEEALKKSPDYILTIDSDRQHQLKEVMKFKDLLNQGNFDLIIGSREEVREMPFRSKLGNFIIAKSFKFLTGSSLKGTQSGYRMLSKQFASDVLQNINPGRYETDMKMLLYGLETQRRISTIQIETVYINGNKNSKFRSITGSIRVLSSFLEYIGVAIASFAIEYIIYLFLIYPFPHLSLSISYIYSHIISRICSAIFNYYANKRIVFKSRTRSHSEKFRYIAAVIFNLLMTSPLLYSLVGFLGFSPATAKPCVQLTMALVNFFVLRNVVFRK